MISYKYAKIPLLLIILLFSNRGIFRLNHVFSCCETFSLVEFIADNRT